MVFEKDFDILTISETWFNSSVSNASVALDGYKLYRLDRLRKVGGGVCAYIRNNLKAKILKTISEITTSGFHQLWLNVQNNKLKSFIIGVLYRPPDCPLSFIDNDLMPRYTEVLSSGKDVVLAGDLNCDLLSENPSSEALLSFACCVGATQLIKDPTRVTSNSSTLIDVLFVSNRNLVKSSGVYETTISDHFLIYAVLNLKVTNQLYKPL
jgi:hypothetical protein